MATFHAMGLRSSKQSTTVGFPTITTREEIVHDTALVTTIDAVYIPFDPIAQTFLVSSGIQYISSVDLYFRSKDSELPITVEIRDTNNGYPARNVFQTCTLNPSEVNVSDDSSLATKFTFEDIVGYEPGEYAICVRTNNIQYELWCSELGGIDVLSGGVIGTQPHWGVLFHSPNNYTWDPWTKKDLKFKINTCNFQNDCQIVFDQLTGVQASYLITLVTQFMPLGCKMVWYYSIDDGDTYIPFTPGIDTELGSIATTIDLLVDITAAGGTFQLIEKYAGIVLLLNHADANYVSKNGVLSEAADTVTVYVDLETDGTNGSGVRSITPYYSVDDGLRWVELEVPDGWTPLSTDARTFYEYKFETPGEVSISDATNASPIVITSSGHGYKDNAVVTIADVGGNTAANGTWLLQNCTADTAELYDPDSGDASSGNGAYTSGGTMVMSEFEQCRLRFYLETSNQAVTPKGRNVRMICG